MLKPIFIFAIFLLWPSQSLGVPFPDPTYQDDSSCRPSISLTFDDGPVNATGFILDVLKEHDVKATFFVVGQQVRSFPLLAARITNEGHEIAIHSNTHPDFLKITPDERLAQITLTKDAINTHSPYPVQHWRAPYGSLPKDLSFAMPYKHVSWTVDPRDWSKPDHTWQMNYILDNIHPSAIVLLHDHAPSTHASLSKTISLIKEMGYDLVPVKNLSGCVVK